MFEIKNAQNEPKSDNQILIESIAFGIEVIGIVLIAFLLIGYIAYYTGQFLNHIFGI